MSDAQWEGGNEYYGSEDAQQRLRVAVAHLDNGALTASERITARNKKGDEEGACAGGGEHVSSWVIKL